MAHRWRPPPEVPGRDGGATRLASIDAFRGFAMLWLIGGAEVVLGVIDLSGPPRVTAAVTEQFGHVAWEGFHFYDLIFPMFVFAAGLSVPMAIDAKLARGISRARITVDALVRTVMLFGLGLVHNGLLDLPAFDELRIMGVLQRIALASLAASLATLVLPGARQLVLLAAGVLLGYALLLTWAAAPVGTHAFGPGLNLSDVVDLQVFGPGQLFTPTGDPEGLVSTLGAIATALLGAAAARYVLPQQGTLGGVRRVRIVIRQGRRTKAHLVRATRTRTPPGAILAGAPTQTLPAGAVERRPAEGRTAVTLAGIGFAALIAGYAWGRHLPVVKQIWTSSFVLVSSGWSLVIFGALFFVADVTRRWRPAVVFLGVIGRQCIVAYVGQELVDLGLTADHLTSGVQRRLPTYAFLLAAMTTLGLKWSVLWLLDRHGFHLRLGLPRRWLHPPVGRGFRKWWPRRRVAAGSPLTSTGGDRAAPALARRP